MINQFISAVSAGLIAIVSFFGGGADPITPQIVDTQAPTEYSQEPENIIVDSYPDAQLGAQLPGGNAQFENALQARLDRTSTSSMTLITNTRLSGYHCFTVDEGRSDMEFICGTVSGTTVSDLERGISFDNGTTTSTDRQFPHRVGANVKVTDYPLIQRIRNILAGAEPAEDVIQYDEDISTTTIGADDRNIANVDYVNDVAFNGASVISATESARGVVEIATQTELASSTQTGGSGTLAVPARYATSTAPASGHYVPVTGSDGKLDANFIPSSITTAYSKASAFFGDGSDGDLTIAEGATTTLVADAYYDDLTVNGVLVTNGYRVFVAGTLSGSGTIKVPDGNDGTDGSDGLSGGTGGTNGTGGTANANGVFRNRAGTDGSTSPTADVGGLGNPGGASAQGGGQSNPTNPSNSVGIPFASSFNYGLTGAPVWGVDFSGTSSVATYAGPAGGQGGSKGVYSSNSGGGETGGTAGAGGGGASGGIVWIIANVWSGTFTIQAIGGDGGDGGDSLNGYYTVGQSSGGAGGAGGVSVVFYGTKTWTGSYSLAGGTAGANGGGAYDLAVTGSSSNGPTGVSYEIELR